jgi:hypothetical protein
VRLSLCRGCGARGRPRDDGCALILTVLRRLKGAGLGVDQVRNVGSRSASEPGTSIFSETGRERTRFRDMARLCSRVEMTGARACHPSLGRLFVVGRVTACAGWAPALGAGDAG